MSLGIFGMSAIFAANFVGVGRAKLTLHFPHQIRKLATRPETLYQWRIALIDRLPVYAAHVGNPELFTLESPRLGKHLIPLKLWLDRDLHTFEIEPPGDATRLATTLTRRLFPGLQHPQPLARAIE